MKVKVVKKIGKKKWNFEVWSLSNWWIQCKHKRDACQMIVKIVLFLYCTIFELKGEQKGE